MKMKKTAAKTTTTPTDQLRERCQGHFLTLRIPVEPAALEELLARAEKESLSHLHFLDLLLGAQANARRERAVERRIRDAHFEEHKTLEGFNWEFNPKAFDRVQIRSVLPPWLLTWISINGANIFLTAHWRWPSWIVWSKEQSS